MTVPLKASTEGQKLIVTLVDPAHLRDDPPHTASISTGACAAVAAMVAFAFPELQLDRDKPVIVTQTTHSEVEPPISEKTITVPPNGVGYGEPRAAG